MAAAPGALAAYRLDIWENLSLRDRGVAGIPSVTGGWLPSRSRTPIGGRGRSEAAPPCERRGLAPRLRFVSFALTGALDYVFSLCVYLHVTALSRAPPAIGGPWWVALAPGSFGDPLRGQGAGR